MLLKQAPVAAAVFAVIHSIALHVFPLLAEMPPCRSAAIRVKQNEILEPQACHQSLRFAYVKGRIVPGRICGRLKPKTRFLPLSTEVKDLKKSLFAAKGSGRRRLKERIRKLKSKLSAASDICAEPDVAGTLLSPGSGFLWASAEPGIVGSGAGVPARPMARWDVVPYQEIKDNFAVGVVAFHASGIDRVEFSVEGGRWTAVREITLNPYSGVYEYWGVIRAQDFRESGLVEIRAMVYPKYGKPRLLADGAPAQNDAGDGSLRLWVNKGDLPQPVRWVSPRGDDTDGNGSQAKPFATLGRALRSLYAEFDTESGARLYLEEGQYETPESYWHDSSHTRRWLTVSPAPGADSKKVVLVGRAGGGTARWNTPLIRLQGLFIRPHASAAGLIVAPSREGRRVWFDAVRIDGGDREISNLAIVNQADTYWTDVFVREYANPVQSWNGQPLLVRNTHVKGVLEDSFRLKTLLINSSATDVDARASGARPHIVRYGGAYEPAENFIVYGLKAANVKSHGIYINARNWALVNVLFHGAQGAWEIDEGVADHILLWHITTVGQPLIWRTGSRTYQARNISIRHSVFEKMSFARSSEGNFTDWEYLLRVMRIRNVHYADAASYGAVTPGELITSGDPRLVDINHGDYSPRSDSPLVGRVEEPIVASDLENLDWTAGCSAIGALQCR